MWSLDFTGDIILTVIGCFYGGIEASVFGNAVILIFGLVFIGYLFCFCLFSCLFVSVVKSYHEENGEAIDFLVRNASEILSSVTIVLDIMCFLIL